MREKEDLRDLEEKKRFNKTKSKRKKLEKERKKPEWKEIKKFEEISEKYRKRLENQKLE